MPMPLTLEDALRGLGRTDSVLDHKVFSDRVVIVFVAGDKRTWKPEPEAPNTIEATPPQDEPEVPNTVDDAPPLSEPEQEEIKVEPEAEPTEPMPETPAHRPRKPRQ